jgi:hypothetical protein
MVDSPILVMYIVVLQTSSNDEEAEDTMSVQNKQGETTPKFSRLKENLLSLSSSDNAGSCVVGKIANSLDEETRQAFFAVMASTASSNSIANTLREEGLVIARSTIVQKRACFTEGGSHMCACFPGLYTGEAQ